MRYRGCHRTLTAAMFIAVSAGIAQAATKPQLPEIRTSAANAVPACVTPERLMAFLKARNRNLDPRFKDIALHYKKLGEGWRVRWDYAFFQMVIETNFLTYRQPNGRMGDVDPSQNNFAGIGTTGGGVPGDGFPDVKTGVLAQMQHLVAYSGERVAAPVASRTQLKQNDIVDASRELGRPVRFSDLARRWAVDKNYGSSIEWAAGSYRSEYCKGQPATVAAAPPVNGEASGSGEVLPWLANGSKKPKVMEAMRLGSAEGAAAQDSALKSAPKSPANPKTASAQSDAAPLDAKPRASVPAVVAHVSETAPAHASPVRTVWSRDGATSLPDTETVAMTSTAAPAAAAAGPASGTANCKVRTASYGGTKTLLLKTAGAGETHYTALTVLDGFESSMSASFLGNVPGGGETVGEFPSKDAAITRARELCPAGG